ncbi:hypothetical protein [Nonomuraea monospora]|uniref:hypothetical protein n=1 Tax=Nonomuraea monospora TaxID=568818 RepID=UPI0031DCD5B3
MPDVLPGDGAGVLPGDAAGDGAGDLPGDAAGDGAGDEVGVCPSASPGAFTGPDAPGTADREILTVSSAGRTTLRNGVVGES